MVTHYKVELKYGYVIYGAHDMACAWELFEDQGVRLFALESIHDEGTLLAGPPTYVDLELENKRHVTN